jgi:hypothetical protein
MRLRPFSVISVFTASFFPVTTYHGDICTGPQSVLRHLGPPRGHSLRVSHLLEPSPVIPAANIRQKMSAKSVLFLRLGCRLLEVNLDRDIERKKGSGGQLYVVN